MKNIRHKINDSNWARKKNESKLGKHIEKASFPLAVEAMYCLSEEFYKDHGLIGKIYVSILSPLTIPVLTGIYEYERRKSPEIFEEFTKDLLTRLRPHYTETTS